MLRRDGAAWRVEQPHVGMGDKSPREVFLTGVPCQREHNRAVRDHKSRTGPKCFGCGKGKDASCFGTGRFASKNLS